MRLLVLLLVIGVLAASAGWFTYQRGNDVPSVDPDDIHLANQSTQPQVADSNSSRSAESAGNHDQTLNHRVGDPTEPAQTTQLEVLVLREPDGVRLCDVEVRATTTDTTPGGNDFRAIGATDAAGVVTFAIPRLDPASPTPRRIRIAAAGSDQMQLMLAPGTPRRVTLRLTPNLFAHGKVENALGKPVPHAEIVFIAQVQNAYEMPQVLRVGRSGPDGSFKVALFADGFLGARHRAFAPSMMLSTYAMPRNPTTNIAIVRLLLSLLPCTASGLVVNPNGTPAANVEVSLSPILPNRSSVGLKIAPIRLRTDRDGRFSTAELRPGTVHFAARGEDLNCARGQVNIGTLSNANLRIQLAAPASVIGTVRGADGKAVTVSVEAGVPGDLFWTRVSCDLDGAFQLDGLPAGESQLSAIEATSADSSVAQRRITKRLSLAPGSTTEWHPVLESLASGRQLRGLVTDSNNQALAGWTVLARQQSPKRNFSVVTGNDGRFVIPCHGNGRFAVYVYAPGQSRRSFAAASARNVDADLGMVFLEVDTISRPATIHGVIQTAAGVSIRGEVACWHRERQQTILTVAATDGKFRLSDIPPGAVTFFFTQPGYVTPSRQLHLSQGDDIDLGVIVLNQSSVVQGTVTCTDGAVPAALEIAIHTDSELFNAEYTAGSYRFESVPAGKHRMLIHGAGIAASALPIEVKAGVDFEQNIVVRKGIARNIRVTALAGSGPWISLALRTSNQDYTWLVGQPRNDSEIVDFTAYMAAGTYEAVPGTARAGGAIPL